MSIDTNNLEYQYRRIAGGNGNDQKSTYAVEFSSGGQGYTFIPTSVINAGVKAADSNYVLPWFLSKENMGELGKQGQYVDLAGKSWFGDYLKDTVGASTTGFLVPSGALPFDSKVSTIKQNVKGVAETEDGPAYILEPQSGKSAQYFTSDGKVTSITPGRSVLGKVFGGAGDAVAGAFNSALGSINDLGPWANAAIAIASPQTAALIAAANAGQGAATGAPVEQVLLNAGKAVLLANAGDGLLGGGNTNAVGGVTGPDNIDVGGGFNPAAGAPITVDTITNAIQTPAAEQIAAEQAAAQQLAAQQAAAHVTSSVSAEALAAANATADPLGALIAKQGWSVVDPAYLASIGVTSGMTPAVDAAVKKGLTFSQAMDLARGGLLVNALTGDPLGLGGGQPEQAAPKGFDIVPIPEDWKSPTYTNTPVQNVSFEDLFPGVSLQGTQWAGLQNQQPNMSFNDIFASGQQQTPMGTPVNIQDIVGSILGQSAKS